MNGKFDAFLQPVLPFAISSTSSLLVCFLITSVGLNSPVHTLSSAYSPVPTTSSSFESTPTFGHHRSASQTRLESGQEEEEAAEPTSESTIPPNADALANPSSPLLQQNPQWQQHPPSIPMLKQSAV